MPILLIQPTWLPTTTAVKLIEDAASRYSGEKLYLLAANGNDLSGVVRLLMPSLRKGSLPNQLAAIRSLRKVMFTKVEILADEARQEFGYFESKVWAFLARTNVRCLGKNKQFYLSTELKDKWLRAVPRMLQKAASLRPNNQTTVAAENASSRLEAFTLINGVFRRHTIEKGASAHLGKHSEQWSLAAESLGFSPTKLALEDVHSDSLLLITNLDPPLRSEDAVILAERSRFLLKVGGSLMMRVSHLNDSERQSLENSRKIGGFELLEQVPSRLVGSSQEIACFYKLKAIFCNFYKKSKVP